MQAAEAITRLIAIADRTKSTTGSFPITPTSEFQQDLPTVEEEQDVVAVHVAQAMLNSMIPVARFRVFVRLESGDSEGAEYTICCTDVRSIKGAMKPLQRDRVQLYVQVWEQRATGADMLLSYQGASRNIPRKPGQQDDFVRWLNSLDQFEASVAVN